MLPARIQMWGQDSAARRTPPRECLMTELADHNTALPLPATASTPPDLTLAHTTRISLIHDSRIPSQVDEKKFTLRYP